MTSILNLLGIAGTIIVAIAYIPQIAHLIRQHCAYGISIKAWFLWLIAAILILPSAIATRHVVFAALLIVNTVATAFIAVFSYFHQGRVCPRHRFL